MAGTGERGDGGERLEGADPTLVGTWSADEVEVAGQVWGRVAKEHPGRYEIEQELGRGGIGRVLAARDTFLQREVALKELLPASEGTTGTLSGTARFLREARITGSLEHPGIVPVHELGEREDGALYYTMKRVRGRTLAHALQQAGTLAERLALLPAYVDVCQAVAYAHSRGVVHRDLKPDNVMLGEFGETVVLDWGLVKLHGEAEATRPDSPVTSGSLTVQGSTLGTPAWMSPEQARGESSLVDERSDAWSLGVVLYQILTGELPFEAEHGTAMMTAVVHQPLVPVRERAPDAPAELEAIAHRALSRDRDARYTARELAEDVQAWLTGGRVRAHEYTSAELLRRFVARNRAATAAAVAIFALTAISAVGLAVGWRTAVEARESAAASAREAESNLALGFQEKANQLLVEREPLAAGVFAAAALLHDPDNPRRGGEGGLRDVAQTSSALYASAVASPIVHDATLARDVGSAVLSVDGEWLAVADEAQVTVVRALTGQEAASWTAPAGSRVWGIDPRGRVVYQAGSSLRLASPEGRDRWAVDIGSPYRVVLSTAGDRIALASIDGGLEIRDASTGAVVSHHQAHESAVEHLAFSPDDRRLASVSLDEDLRVWSLEGFELLHELHLDGEALAWLPDGQTLLVGTETGQVVLWRPGQEPDLLGSSHRGAVSAVAASESLFASGDSTGRLHLWSPGGERVRLAATQTRDMIMAGEHLFSASPARVDRWRLEEKVPLLDVGQHVNALLPDRGRLLGVSDDGTLRAWIDGEAQVLAEGDSEALAVAAHPDHLAVGRLDGSVTLHDPLTGKLIRRFVGPEEPVWALAISPDGDHLAVGHEDGLLAHWSTRDGTPLDGPAGQGSMLQSVAFSPDGDLLITTDLDAHLRVWSLSQGRALASLELPHNGLTSSALSPDGRRLLVMGRTPATLRSLPDAAVLLELGEHDSIVLYGAFSPDGSLMATASIDGQVCLWDAQTGRLRLALHLEELNGVALPSSEVLAVGVASEIRLYPLVLDIWDQDPQLLVQEAEARAGARLEGFTLVRN